MVLTVSIVLLFYCLPLLSVLSRHFLCAQTTFSWSVHCLLYSINRGLLKGIDPQLDLLSYTSGTSLHSGGEVSVTTSSSLLIISISQRIPGLCLAKQGCRRICQKDLASLVTGRVQRGVTLTKQESGHSALTRSALNKHCAHSWGF